MLRYRVTRFLKRVTPLTWVIWLAFLADVAQPGWMRFDLLVLEVDISDVAGEVRDAFTD